MSEFLSAEHLATLTKGGEAQDAAQAQLAAMAAAWAEEDAEVLAEQLADLRELRGLAMRLLRGAAAESLARTEAVPGAVEAGAAAAPDGRDGARDDGEARDGRAGDGRAPAPAVAPTSAAAATFGFGGGFGGGVGVGVGVGVGISAGAAGAAGRGALDGARNPDWAFALFERTVRLTIALEQKLRAERARGAAGGGAGIAGGFTPVVFDPPMPAEQLDKTRARLIQLVLRRRRIITVVQEGQDEETVAAVGRALEPELLDHQCPEVLNLPIGRMAARILRQMGVRPDWSRWKDEDWALEEAETLAEGSPFGAPAQPLSWRGGAPVWAPGEGPAADGAGP